MSQRLFHVIQYFAGIQEENEEYTNLVHSLVDEIGILM